MNQDFFKQPSFIASAVAFLSFFILPFYRFKLSFLGVSTGGNFSGLKIATDGAGIDFLLFLVPIAAGWLMYSAWKNADNYVMIAKWVFLIAAAFFVLRYGFLMEYSKLSSVGFGLWVALLCAIFVMFESQIMAKINANKKTE